MKEIYTKENAEKLQEIKDALANDGEVRVVNQYETIYGWGFDKWLRDGLKDFDVNYEIVCYNHFADCGYPWEYIITVNK